MASVDSNRLVNFVVAGAQKSGTSSLFLNLKKHPQICLSEKKELHFFDNDEYFSTNPINYDLYHKNFNPAQNHVAIGECTPIYMYWNPAAERMFRYNNNLKIIIILRDPISRAFSHWNDSRIKGYENLSFSDAIRNEKNRLTSIDVQSRHFSYIDRGFYTQQILRLYTYFKKNNVLILNFDLLSRSPNSIGNQISDFLSVENFKLSNVVANSRKYSQHINAKDKKFLIDIFNDEIINLGLLLDWDVSAWLTL